MEGVGVEEMLAARDRRALLQKNLIQRYQVSLVYLTMNIPGPVKRNERIEKGFRLGCKRVEEALSGEILAQDAWTARTGCEAYWVVAEEPLVLKKAMLLLEEKDGLGRLLDLDVLDSEGRKLGRTVPRRCLLCSRPAAACARSRTHSIAELTARIETLLAEEVE